MEFNIEMANHPSWDRKIPKEKKMNSFQLMEQENQGNDSHELTFALSIHISKVQQFHWQ